MRISIRPDCLQWTIVFIVFLLCENVSGQTVLWSEDFNDEANGATSGTASGGTWSTTTPSGGASSFAKQTYSVKQICIPFDIELFQINNSVTEGVWMSNVIDISGTGEVAVAISLASGTTNPANYVRAYYVIDGGAEVLFAELYGGSINLGTVSSIILTGSSLQIVVRGNENTAGSHSACFQNELNAMGFDDVSVIAIETLYSRASANWATSGTWSKIALGGTDCACTPNEYSHVVVGNNNTVSMNAAANAIDVTVQNTGILRWTANNIDLNIHRGGDVTVATGGSINRNGATGVQIDFDWAGETNTVTVENSASLSVEDFDINTAAIVSFEGAGSYALSDDILVSAAATVSFNQSGSFTVGDDINISAAATVSFNQSGSFTVTDDVIVSALAPVTFSQTGTFSTADIVVSSATTLNFNQTNSFSVTGSFSNTAASVLNFNESGIFSIGNDLSTTAASSINFNQTNNFTITDDFLVSGAATIINNAAAGTFTITDDLNFNTDNASFTNNRTLSMGDLVVNDNGDDGNSFTNASTGTLNTGTITPNDGNLTINNYGTINQSGNFVTLDAGSSFINRSTGTWNRSVVGGTVDADITSVLNCSASGNTFNYIGAGNQPVIAVPYYNVLFSTSGTKTLASALDVNGDLTIQNTAVLNSNNQNITLAGNWSVLNTASFTEGTTTSTVTFDGSGNQFISNAAGETFNLVVVNKPTGSLTLSNNVTIANGTGTDLTLTQGVINSSVSALLILEDNVTSTAGDNDSYVDGPIRKVGNDAFIFPTGDGTRWARIGISAPTGTTTQFTAQYFANAYPDLTHDGTLHHPSAAEYWILDRAVNTPSVSVTLFWENNFSDITDFTDLRVARYNGTDWVSEGQAATSGAVGGPGTITSVAVANFSPFSFGSGGGINPLPIELINFNAIIKNHQVELTWETASELNNDFFTIERAVNVENFEVIGERVKGKGTTNQRSDYKFMDTHPIYGRSYYRLKQTDFDGKFTYSKVELIDYEGPAFPVFEANPTLNQGKEITLKVEGLRDLKEFPIKLINAQGAVVWQKIIPIKYAGTLEETIVFDQPLPAGFYILRGPSIFFTQKIVVE